MKPVVDGLQAEYAGVVDFDVHADLNSDAQGGALARAHGVQAVPTMVLTDATGRELGMWVGAVPAQTLRDAFNEARE